MSSDSFAKRKANKTDVLSPWGYGLVVDDWIFRNVTCVLLYKDKLMDIYPIEAYTDYELTMLQRDSNYKSARIPIRYGSFIDMQKCMYEIAREGLHAIDAKSLEIK